MTVKKIDLEAPPEVGTFLIMGPTRSGKTELAATFPRPRFLSDMSEKGYETIRSMKKRHSDKFFEPGRAPEVYGIETPQDFIQMIADTDKVARTNPGQILTLVIDSLTYYADLYFDYMEREELRIAPNAPLDTRKLYGMLLGHLRRTMIKAHSIPGINVVWLGLDTIDENTGRGGLLVPGKSANKLPAACNYIWYQRSYRVGKDELAFETRTRQYNQFNVGGRDGGLLPDPMESSYKAFAEIMQLPLTVVKGKK